MSEYNGWTNYETWVVNLWLDNDEGTQEMVKEWTLDCIKIAKGSHDPYTTPEKKAVRLLVESLKDWVDESNPTNETSSLYADLLSAAISSVNYYEIADHYVTEWWTDDESEDEEGED
jgi:hypothetical protein